MLGQQLTIYSRSGVEWVLTANVSSLLYNYLKNNPIVIDTTDSSQKKQVYSHRIVKFTWTSPLKDEETEEPKCYLIVANSYNKFFGILDRTNDSAEPAFIKELAVDCGSQTISSLCWAVDASNTDDKGILAIGFMDGSCQLVTLSYNLGVLNISNFNTAADFRSVEHLHQIRVSEL